MSHYNPWAVLRDHPEWTLHFANLVGDDGQWCAASRTIILNTDLQTRARRRCALAHELEHAFASDAACTGTADDAYFTNVMERRATRRAARKLIALDALADAIALYDDDDVQIAEHLDVDLDTLDIRRDALQPLERHYLRRRLAEVHGEDVA